MNISEVPDKIFEDYEINKRAEQQKKGEAKKEFQNTKERDNLVMKHMYQDYMNEEFNFDTIKTYLTEKLGLPPIFHNSYINKFRSYYMSQQASERVRKLRSESEEPTVETESEVELMEGVE